MKSPAPDYLPAADSAWLRMEQPSNLMTITGILVFRGVAEFAAMERLLRQRLMVHERFRQRVAESSRRLGRPRWVRAEDFDMADHLVRVTLPPPGDKAQLERLVSRLMSTPLDPARPLWQWHFVEGFSGRSAMIGRIHHCIGDGMSLIRMVLGLADRPLDEAAPQLGRPPRRLAPTGPLALVRAGAAIAGTLTRLVAMRADPPSLFKGALGTEKRAAWSGRMPLERIKEVGRRTGGTVNDVLLAAVTGALRSYMGERAKDLERRNLRAVIPVNLRAADDLDSLGNRFGLMFLELPVGTAGPLERLREIKRQMDRIKTAPDAHVIFGVLELLGKTSAAFQERVLHWLSKNATAVMTNVPGPRAPLIFAGAEISDALFWVPQSGRLGLGVSILSYAGDVRIGIASDAGLIPDPERIVAAFGTALTALETA